MAGSVDAKDSSVGVSVVEGRGRVHPVVTVQHVRVEPESGSIISKLADSDKGKIKQLFLTS